MKRRTYIYSEFDDLDDNYRLHEGGDFQDTDTYVNKTDDGSKETPKKRNERWNRTDSKCLLWFLFCIFSRF